jgi:aryl-alcohol dehydrogenase-like predicted oxidoreductase
MTRPGRELVIAVQDGDLVWFHASVSPARGAGRFLPAGGAGGAGCGWLGAMTAHDMTRPGEEFLLGGDLKINRLGFGAMRLARGALQGPARNRAEGLAVLRRAVELGVNHIDTAWFYRAGDLAANDLIRAALWPYPENLVIATKVGPLLGPSGTPEGQSAASGLRELVEQNLTSLRLDRLDLVYLRIGGRGAPSGESIGERFAVLARLREEGLIRQLGVSNIDRAQLAEARAIAPVAAVQNQFHVHRQQDPGLLRDCEANEIGFVPFFPLGGGTDPLDPARLEPVARRHAATVHQVALAYLLTRSPVILAIPGTGSAEHLAQNMEASRIALTAEDMAELAAPGTPTDPSSAS